jgi:hypothetical protein
MRANGRLGGAALLLVAVAFSAFWSLELYREALGFQDADNPATMIAFLRQHPNVYTWSGIAFVVMGVALVVAVLAVRDLMGSEPGAVAINAAAVLGLFAAAFFFGQGVLRVQSPGTLMHMAGMGREWGHAAFLAVQMAGTQGLASAGAFALSLWAVWTSVAGQRRRALPRFVPVLAVAPAAHLLLGLFGPLLDALPGVGYLIYIGATFGVIFWCIALGVVLLRWTPIDERTGD